MEPHDVSDSQKHDLPELELDPVTEQDGSGAGLVAEPAAAFTGGAGAPADADSDETSAEGQWVWQYAAPAPPAPFSAAFFSGNALPELYRFFACGLLVVVGCFLPWGPQSASVPNPALTDDPTAAEFVQKLLPVPEIMGVHTTLGAISLVIGLWLMFSACYGVYTRRQKILPVFLMLEPAIVSWDRMLGAYEQVGMDGGVLALLDAAGTGLLLTLVGSTLVSLQFLFVVGKVYAKKDDKGAGRTPRKSKAKDEDGAVAAAIEGADADGSKGRRKKR